MTITMLLANTLGRRRTRTQRFQKHMEKQPLVGILMGSDSDWPVMRACAGTLNASEHHLRSACLVAHRTPDAALTTPPAHGSAGVKV